MRKEIYIMGKIYAKAIIAGTRTYSSIGTTWRAATLAALEAMVQDGTITAEQLAELTAD